MSSVVIDTTELVALAATFTASAATIDAKSKQSTATAAEATELRARQLAPFRTGQLRNSIRSDDNEVTADAPHAIYVEFGTSRAGPQPFMFPAADLGERVLEELSENDVDPFRA